MADIADILLESREILEENKKLVEKLRGIPENIKDIIRQIDELKGKLGKIEPKLREEARRREEEERKAKQREEIRKEIERVTRRKFITLVGGAVAGMAISGAAGWLIKPAERVEVPGPRVRETVTVTVPEPTPRPEYYCPKCGAGPFASQEELNEHYWVAHPELLPECCSERGGISLDFSKVEDGTLPPQFIFRDVEFTRLWGKIGLEGGSLWCWGSEEWNGVWHDATVKLDFWMLPCRVCEIIADVDGGGREARLEGRLLGGEIQTAVCPGDKRILTLKSPDRPFLSATLSGQEAAWFWIDLG